MENSVRFYMIVIERTSLPVTRDQINLFIALKQASVYCFMFCYK